MLIVLSIQNNILEFYNTEQHRFQAEFKFNLDNADNILRAIDMILKKDPSFKYTYSRSSFNFEKVRNMMSSDCFEYLKLKCI